MSTEKVETPNSVQNQWKIIVCLPLGALLGMHLESSWGSWRLLGSSWRRLGPSGGHLGRRGTIFGRLGPLLDRVGG
eukprot:8870317-Pyramimonas_sp.AAC.1